MPYPSPTSVEPKTRALTTSALTTHDVTTRNVTTRARSAPRSWRKPFLEALAASSNVAASAREAGIDTARAYEARRSDASFAAQWREALCEGYDHLEMALLQRLRAGEIKPAAHARRGTRVFDNATALRLLAMHRDSVQRERAAREGRQARFAIEAVEARLDRVRERMLDDARREVDAAPEPAAPAAGAASDASQ